LLSFILLLSSPVHANDQAYPHCKRKTDRYHDLIERSNTKKQRCSRDSDCVLLFEGNKLSWCDLGFALSKTAMGNSWLKKLERARVEAEKSCPTPPADRATCSTKPATKAKCIKRRCETD
jgi:hypothetical protein